MLDIRLSFRPGTIADVSVAGAQPRVAELLTGCTPAAALQLLGRLYAVCGRGQRAAAELALAAADGVPRTDAETAASAKAVALEALQEHLWRLLVDWPRHLGLGDEQATFVRWHRAADPERGDLPVATLVTALERDWLGLPLRTLAELNLASTRRWAAASDTPLGRVFDRLLARTPLSAPVACLAPREAGVIARLSSMPWVAELAGSAPIAARVAARVMEVGRLLGALAVPCDVALACGFAASRLAPGRGRGELEVARGRLVHTAELEGRRISGYVISVPTDANFAADGAYAWHVRHEHPEHVAAALEAGQHWALALDPCIPYRVSVGEVAYA